MMFTKSLFTIGFSLIVGALIVTEGAFADSMVYTAYDSNEDGFLDKTEFAQFIEKRRVKDDYRHLWVFEEMDQDGDGRISNNELVQRLQEEIKLRTQSKKH